LKRVVVFLMVASACGRTEVYRPREPQQMTDAGAPDAGRPDAGPARDAGTPDAGAVDAGMPSPSHCDSADAGAPQPGACEAQVTVGLILPDSPSCFVDIIPTPSEVATLRWDCTGDTGNAEIIFAKGTFGGSFNSPNVSVCSGTTFEYTDGCMWESAQRIEGSVTRGSTLTFNYAEAPLPGQMGCESACTASGTLIVE
jgi:hypothetical protein